MDTKIADLENTVTILVKGLRQAIINDLPAGKKAELELELAKLEQGVQVAQIELNKIEAANSNLFIAGWRPFIGWICGVALGLYFIAFPILESVITGITLPKFDMGTLMTLVMSILGLGSMRSWEKGKGVNQKH